MRTPIRNPYIAGKALNDERGFFGREDVFRVVQYELEQQDRNAVVLFGQRRIGKTSILLNLRLRLPSPPFFPVYFDLMDRARKSLADVLYELAVTVAQELNLTQPARSDFDDDGREFREKFLPTVYSRLGQERLVLLLDEFDVLDVSQEERLPDNAAARAFFPYLRALMVHEPRIGFVFVVGRKAEELGIEFKAAFKASRYYRVSMLDEESAKALVLLAQQQGALRFQDDAVKRILALTARHTYLTQLMCQLLFEKAYQQENVHNTVPIITAPDADAIVPKVLDAGENVFEWIWDGLPPAERVIFSAIATDTNEESIITEERLMDVLQSQGIRILIRELELAPRTLVEWEMLKQADGGYKFFVELLRRWVAERKPLAKVKDELDRIVPLADTLFQGANGFYMRGMMDNAAAQLQQALTVNPNHLKARLLLGEIFRSQGKFDDAIHELDEAYRIDEASGRVPLENALLQKAGAFEKNDQTDEAFKIYERVLAISHNNRVAQERLAAIWLKRGETALKANDMDSAIAAFQEAGAIERIRGIWITRGETALHANDLERARASFQQAQAEDRIAAVDELKRKRELEAEAQPIEGLLRQEKWDEAITTYEHLVELDPEDTHWRDGLASAKEERKIAHRYAEGLGAMQQKKWTEAQRAFADVVYLRPGYKDATLNLKISTDQVKSEIAAAQKAAIVMKAKIAGTQTSDARQRKSWRTRNVLIGVGLVVILCIAVIVTLSWGAPNLLTLFNGFKRIAFSPDGTLLASASDDGSPFRLWNTADGSLVRTFNVPTYFLGTIAFSPDGNLLAMSCLGACIVKTSDGSRFSDIKYADSGSVESLAFSPDGNLLAIGSYDKTTGLYRVSDGSLVRAFEPYTNAQSVTFSPDGNLVAAGYTDGTVRLWSAVDGSVTREFKGHTSYVTSVAFSPDGSRLASGSWDHTIRLWKVSDGSLVRELNGSLGLVYSVSFSPDDSLLASGASDNAIRLWKVSDGTLVRTLTGHTGVVKTVTFSPDGKLVASGSTDKTLRLWNVDDGSPVRVIK